ncbi:MAG TPA: aspartyl/asparaginyl beta-hydroxylase domain-containing protein [Myxococcota bacterium]
MKYFERLERGVDVAPILAEIERQPDAWARQTGRQEKAGVQRETAAIPIRGLRKSRIRCRRRRDVHESRYTTLSHGFPAAVSFIRLVALERDAELGRAKIVSMRPHGRVHPHVDRGHYYALRDRLHLVVQSPGGSRLRAGEEEVRMREGELWWFDNKQLHEAFNDSDVERIHLIFDLLPRGPEGARSRRTAPSVCDDGAAPDLERLLAEASALAKEGDGPAVQQGVRLYLAGRERPRRWQQLIERHAPGARADSAPFRAAAHLLLAEAAGPRQRACARAMAWAMARLELGALRGEEIPERIASRGGAERVASDWQREKASLR